MADVPFTLALMIGAIPYLLPMTSQIGRTAPLYSRLRKVRASGKLASEVIEKGGATVSNIAEGADGPDASVNGEDKYVHDFGTYSSVIKITEQARRASSVSTGPAGSTGTYSAKLANQVATRVVQILEKLESHLWTGTGPGANQIVGFEDAIGDTTNTYAGIDRTIPGNEYWQPNVFDDGVPTSPTKALIEDDMTEIATNAYKPGSPDIIIANDKIFNAVRQTLQGQVSYNVTTQNPAMPNDLSVQVSMGVLQFGNAVMFKDVYAPVDSITYLNSQYVWLEYLPYAQALMDAMAMLDPEVMNAIREAMMNADLSDQLLPLDMMIKELGATGAADKLMLGAFPTLVVSRPNACGMRKNISV